ncbi:type IX secretion system motor protein PorM/GldM [Winogradskyella aurantiaca]|uniref:type IX secretion system motor protein PorM/GldM n=1 Tax=Winogradskyella aurantiaca TaxID=2219558 RepID=UPI000E1D6211|nr:gliding motility protein GldM [Winogradskyella aurantiaca]
MAGGNVSARQKMINLMYLVFIAMMAMNMSKEVLSAFGLMDEKFETSNESATERNAGMLANLMTKAEEKPLEFKEAAEKADQIAAVSDKFYGDLEKVKQFIIKEGGYELDENGKLPFQAMDKTDILDEAWFTGDRLTKEGDRVMAIMEKYKSDIKAIIGDDIKYQSAVEDFEKRFDFSDVKPLDGAKIGFLDYNFKGFPAIASYTKITAMQNDVKVTETNMYNLFLGNTLDEAVTLKNYQAIVLADKSAFFAGEQFSGKVVLGKYANVKPTAMSVGGNDINVEEAMDSTGAARLNFNVGNVGKKDISGTFTFMEDGQPLEIPIKGNYVVVPQPNSATIAADKMNVVYRGVENPMTISFSGVPDNKVKATAPGLREVGNGKYVMTPGSGREVTIKVDATLDGGKVVSDSKLYRIKDIPKPTGTIGGQDGMVKLPKRNVEIGTIGAKLDDFDFDLPIQVQSFKLKVPGQPTVVVQGTKMNAQAKGVIKRARPGDIIQIFDIKAKIQGNSKYNLKTPLPLTVEVTN